jgi:PPOX class probable F420-dependent enzyme
MPAVIPDTVRDLLERPIVAAAVTVMTDGQPQATPVWFDHDGTYFRINTAEGRQKARNLARNSKVTLLVIDPQNPFHWIEVRGHVAQVNDEEHGGRAHINALSLKYRGDPDYKGMVPGERRLQYLIEADKINASAGR